MRDEKKKRLEVKGWKIGDARDFLRLTPEEAAYVELKLKLADGLRTRRRRRGITQVELARKVQSSQSRIAKMEAGDPSVTLDLLIRSLLVLGASPRDIARMIGPSRTTSAA
jgi:DNA-binding XRE family transcriptional regulator